MGIKETENHKVFAYADSYVDKNGLAAINIRIANRSNRNDLINIPVYLSNGQRLKAKPELVGGGIIKNNSAANVHIDNLTNTIVNFISINQNFNKKVIEHLLYPDGFLDQHKQKRTRTIEIPQYTLVPKPVLAEYRQHFPKQRAINTVQSVDQNGFLVTTNQEVIVDPLSLEDFPNNFDKTAFDKFYAEYLATGRGMFDDPKHENDPQMREIDNAWVMGDLKQFITDKLFIKQLQELKTISKPAITKFESSLGQRRIMYSSNPGVWEKSDEKGIMYGHTGKPLLSKLAKQKLINIQNAQDISNMSTEEIYKKGYWNKNNIFEMFGSTYYDDTVNETYTKIVVRLMEYREHVKPSEHIRDFNADWVNAFFNWLQKTGWYHINTRNFDPLKYDPQIFFQPKERSKYEVKSLNKMKGILKALTVGVKGEKTVSFYKKGWLPMIDLSDVKTDKSEKKGTRIDHNLTKEELDKLFHYKFSKAKLPAYQETFNAVNKSQSVIISIRDLETARDIFILQTWFGGLRGYKEYDTAKIIKHSKNYIVSFYQNKVTNTVINPLNEYTSTILQKYDYKKPVLERMAVRKNKKTDSIDLLEQHYRSLLRTIAHILNFDREVLVDKRKNEFDQVKDLFGPYFARKTFGQIMWDKYGLREQEIALFTGHVDGTETELGVSYINKHGIETKSKFFKKVKIGENS